MAPRAKQPKPRPSRRSWRAKKLGQSWPAALAGRGGSGPAGRVLSLSRARARVVSRAQGACRGGRSGWSPRGGRGTGRKSDENRGGLGQARRAPVCTEKIKRTGRLGGRCRAHGDEAAGAAQGESIEADPSIPASCWALLLLLLGVLAAPGALPCGHAAALGPAAVGPRPPPTADKAPALAETS